MEPRSISRFITRVRNPLWSVAAVVIVVDGMREAREILIPVAVAGMMAIACSPAVRWLEKRRIPNVAAVIAVVIGLMGILGAIGALLGASVSGFKDSIPTYRDRLASMIVGFFDWLGAHGIQLKSGQLINMIEPGSAAEKAAGFISSSLSGLGAALSNTLLVMLTMILILMEGASVPGKLRALAGDPEADISQYAIIAEKVQSYLAIKTVLSIATGVIVGVWAWILDVDFAALWGLLAFLLNYIPNVGSILAAFPAMLLALVQHGIGTTLALGAGYVVVNMVLGNVVEPMWMGRKLGLSTTVVFVSLVIWYWMWGSVGMFLSVPLTMVIKIMLENSRGGRGIAAALDAPGATPLVVAVDDSLAPPQSTGVESTPPPPPSSTPSASGPVSEAPPTSRSPGMVEREPDDEP